MLNEEHGLRLSDNNAEEDKHWSNRRMEKPTQGV